MAPKKKRTDEEKEQSKVVEPETMTQKATAGLQDVLKAASDARTAAIKLQGLEFADQLSKQLLDHAAKLEKMYGKLNTAICAKKDDKTLKQLLTDLEDILSQTTKAQAWCLEICTYLLSLS